MEAISPVVIIVVVLLAAAAAFLVLRSRGLAGGGVVDVDWRRSREVVRESGHSVDGITIEAVNNGKQPATLTSIRFLPSGGAPIALPWTKSKFPCRLEPGQSVSIFFSDKSINDSVRLLGNPGQKVGIVPQFDDAQRRSFRGREYVLTIVP